MTPEERARHTSALGCSTPMGSWQAERWIEEAIRAAENDKLEEAANLIGDCFDREGAEAIRRLKHPKPETQGTDRGQTVPVSVP